MFTAFLDKAVDLHLISEEDRSYTLNRILEILQLDAPPAGETIHAASMAEYFVGITEEAVRLGVCEDTAEARDRFSARIAGTVTPSPRETRERFFLLEKESGSESATSWFYRMCRDTDYIRTRRIAQNVCYQASAPCGRLEITYNLSKPEKDPRDIAKALKSGGSGYPRCALCVENPGYAGRPGFPARQNHRIIPLLLGGEKWYLQYSPYAYYEEHCIVLNASHVPMHMTEGSFVRLFDFVDRFPHYFLGANADLPIVGGSILTHDHFQGGRHVFPMDHAHARFTLRDGSGLRGSVLQWPLTCLKWTSDDREQLTALAMRVLDGWRSYSDPENGIVASDESGSHNAITPVVRKNGGTYTLYLLLRNNLTSAEHPLGIFHPHAEWHHIKKENIGLIEAIGLFILPGRLKKELADVRQYLCGLAPLDPSSPHASWAAGILDRHGVQSDPDTAEKIIREEVGQVCYHVLDDCGVYKQTAAGTEGLKRFLASVGVAAD